MSRTRNARPLGSGLLRLEDRAVPAVLGNPWPDASGLTISFPKDGTKATGVKSSLEKVLGQAAGSAVWQGEILRAFQTWAVSSNINLGLVKDGGDDFGADGQTQGDERFGDIRVGAIPLGTGQGAIANPYDWTSGTWSGDVLLNSTAGFAVNPPAGSDRLDLYTVALHEAGHVLGLDHSDDPASVMYGQYTGRRTGPSAQDVADLQAAYGTRQPDGYEGAAGNDSRATATSLPVQPVNSLTADLTTTADADVYAFSPPAGKDKVKVRLTTGGVSLLTAQVQVLDANGSVLKAVSTTDPMNGDLAVDVDHLVQGQQYYARVTAARQDEFGVGRYQLQVNFADQSSQKAKFVKDQGSNDSRETATPLTAADNQGRKKGSFAYNGVLESAADADWYRVAAPATAVDGAMLVTVRAVKSNRTPPVLAAYDAAGGPVQLQLLRSTGSRFTVQAVGVAPGAAYYLRLTNPTDGSDGTGNYRLDVDFGLPQGLTLDRLAAGQLGPAASSVTDTLSVSTGGLFQFYLSGGGLSASPEATLTLTVTDTAGKAVLALTVTSAQPAVTGAAYLAAGSYTVRVALAAPKDVSLPMVAFDLLGGVGSDPVGTYTPPSGTSTTPGTYTYGGSSTTRPQGAYYTF